ncbi:acyl-CoA thioesterase [Geotalea toluenoxydans]|uniref:acyl-CoA thioesterase n=1 Tax=Geotalea toluenoxydans TaxID=421624 RepID=UPI000ADB7914|nr:acyl-CoA thioesterase [Geotalea toluenoxydans]
MIDQILKGFPIVVEFPVAWGEMDSQKHVNNVVYFRYMENARIAYYDRIGAWQMMEETGIGTVLASSDCRYRIPLTYPDTLSVGAKVVSIEADRFTMEYRVVSHRLGKLAAEGKGVLVAYDFREDRKTVLPEALVRNMEALEATVGEN